MTTVRLDEFVTCRCDCCGKLGELVEFRAGWRWQLDGWLFYAIGDVQLCSVCRGRTSRLKRESVTRPDEGTAPPPF